MNREPYIGSTAVAVPSRAVTQEEGKAFIEKYYSGKLSAHSMRIMRRVFGHPSVRERRFAFNNIEILINENPDLRMKRFTRWAVKLSSEAARKALKKAGIRPNGVSALVVNTCTGYICPGISTYLMEELGLRKTTKLYDLVGSGCGGAIPNLEICRGLLKESKKAVVLSVSVEICSCTFQMEDNVSLIISNAIFGDGAAASVLWNRKRGLKIVSSHSEYAPEHREEIRFIYKGGQLHNQLSLKLPRLSAEIAGRAVKNLLKGSNLKVEDVKYWVLHSGGENVINAVKEKIGLREEDVACTRNVLARFGNVSSPTVWFVLNELQNSGMDSNEWLVMLAFGAGLSAHAMLLRT